MGRSPTNTKGKLLQTASDLIWQSSYGSVSVDDICRASGVKKGSFYYYFPSKAELIVAVMEAFYLTSEAEMIDVFSATISPIKRFENLADFVYDKQKQAFDKYGRVCGCPFASLGSEMAGNEELIQQKVNEVFHRQEAMIMPTLQEMIDSGQLPIDTVITTKASEIIAFILGQVMMARIQNNLNHLKKNAKIGLLRTIGIEASSSVISTKSLEEK